jgi:glycosyltransferase involved in cell wall biosynthesis
MAPGWTLSRSATSFWRSLADCLEIVEPQLALVAAEVTPTVSVVIPTHNRRELLLRTIHSVLAQALDFEVLVVDDGSTDGTAEAVRFLNDRRIRVLRNERPVRVAAARNIGAEAATGAWIALLDDDDLWSPEKLERQFAAVEVTGRNWVYAGAVEIDERGRFLGGEPPPLPEELLNGLADKNLMPAGCSNVMIRAELFREVGGFDIRLRHLADWDLWLRLAVTGPPDCVALPLVAYRIHARQATLDPNDMIAEGRILEARHGADLNSIRRWLAWSHLRRGERHLAVRAYVRAALAGNVSSLGRAAVAALHSRPTTIRRRTVSASVEWQRAAESWLRSLGDR